MKTIKPYGRSFVENKKRQIEHNKEKPNNKESIEKFVHSDKFFFIAQWASILDKIIKKPDKSGSFKKGKFLNEDTYEARENLSEAFIKLWKSKDLIKFNQDEDFLKKWKLKVHPYKIEKIENKQGIEKGRWYKRFIGNNELNQIDWDELAENVYQHLYENKLSIYLEEKEYKKGLIDNLAESISNNTRKFEVVDSLFQSLSANEKSYIKSLKENILLKNWKKNWEEIRTAYQLEELVNCLIKEENNKKYLSRRDAIKCLYDHYKLIFSEDVKIKELQTENHEKHKQWLYHCIIKEALYQHYPKFPPSIIKEDSYQPRPKFAPKKAYQLDVNSLHNLALSIERNRIISFAIRLGKVIHYTAENDALAGTKDLEKIANSDCWTSEKQTEIKQKESFIKQWLGALSIANSSLRRLAAPDYQGKDIYVRTIEIDDKKYFDDQFNLLFGENHNLYNENRDAILKCLRCTLADIRNASFHFNTVSDVLKTDTNIDDQEIKPAIEQYIKKHLEKQRALLIESLKAAHIETHLNQEQADIFLAEIQQKTTTFLLPKFSKLLTRADNINPRKTIIKAANQTALQENKTLLCQFVCLKQIYESGFHQWLEEQNTDLLNSFLQEAKNTATESAEKMNRRNALEGEEIKARMDRLRDLKTDEKLLDYFSYLAAETASFFQVKINPYISNVEGTKAQSNFIEDFKKDFLALAFKCYLKEKELEFLLRLIKGATCQIQESQLPLKTEIKNSAIYISLHLIPVEFVSHLALQIKKYHILTGKTDLSAIAEAIDLYLSMHNATLDITSLQDSELKDFYENEEVFNGLFKQNNELDEQLIPVRGLRELLKFGNLAQLKKLFADSKIKDNEIEELKKQKDSIAEIQEEKKRLHEKLSRSKSIRQEDFDRYAELANKTENYSHLKNRVYLHHQKQIHQLMITILGRLVDFSHLWERDIYFAMLSILTLRGLEIKNEDFEKFAKKGNIIKVSDIKELVQEGQIIKALYKIKDTHKAIYNKLDDFFFISNNRKIRNDFTHFNSLNKPALINLTKLLNEARKLTQYDRKLKNSVTKSITELLKKDNLKINFKMEKNELLCDSLEVKKVEHLKGKRIEKNYRNSKNRKIIEELHSEKYKDAVAKLFKK